MKDRTEVVKWENRMKEIYRKLELQIARQRARVMQDEYLLEKSKATYKVKK